ncbi:RimJ/RimL family protein N-acetyltransferase [Microbacterium halimionae]|uniref:RimJ/RimL family protein N-acetyltransferase n=1 Tax=Microbacterium halimionae TaxID=1526413 RepID=A0A7W3JN94_9MICO|nr:GNAT family N-acetyltransferase [Microbacterium halimionae]MBA8815972.1 RimJ/RimL family protein N-acetyltransferase [Microbacterium halimionae]NII96175.1 RimJ/RimL family protein N-acetyltransferase [Microbacterium halimionae]
MKDTEGYDLRIETTRLSIRPLQEHDLPALELILGDAITMTAYEGAFSPRECASWLRRQRERYATDGCGLWAVVERSTGELVGQCGITRQLIDSDEVWEVGYLFRRDVWGRGFATEAASASRDWAFEALDADAIFAKVRDTNIASMNVAIRLGMTVQRSFTVNYRGVDMRHLAFAIDRATWRSGSDRV